MLEDILKIFKNLGEQCYDYYSERVFRGELEIAFVSSCYDNNKPLYAYYGYNEKIEIFREDFDNYPEYFEYQQNAWYCEDQNHDEIWIVGIHFLDIVDDILYLYQDNCGRGKNKLIAVTL